MEKSRKSQGRCKSKKKRPPCERKGWILTKNSTKISSLSFIDKQTTKLALIPHSHQKLNCLKRGVSYSSIVSLSINQ